MVTGWLLKVVVAIGLLGFAAIELGSPLVARAQADDAAQEVAMEAAFQLGRTNDVAKMQQTCAEAAAARDVTVDSCQIDQEGNIAVTVTKEARSFLLYRFSATRDWYSVSASAGSPPR
jgi:Flp pilus assembly protein TadG